MEHIEINEYVRTKDGIIGKVFEEDDIGDKGVCIDNSFFDDYAEITDFVYYENILKHSMLISEVVEVGDIVNGMEVLDIHKPRDLWEPIEIRVDSRYTNFILAEDIQTILTKESYMANCYKVGGEENERI